jgi:UDP-2-acetamido-3-amino-2,3-dideoxy-glucuronate N-acetyltransferase
MHELIEVQELADNRGRMNIIEFSALTGFNPLRMFTIQDVPVNSSRGKHAHKDCIQVLHCLIGKVEVQIEHKGNKSTVLLNSPKKVLYIPPMNWLEIKFLEDTTILNVYASDIFKELDYIRDYSEFLTANNES